MIEEEVREVGYLAPADAETFKSTLIRQVRANMGNGPRPLERETVQVEETKVVSAKQKRKKTKNFIILNFIVIEFFH